MREFIKNVINKAPKADYLEIRVEETQTTRIDFVGKELENIGNTTKIGGNVRALVNGGWGFVSFNAIDQLDTFIELAVKEATTTSKTKFQLAPVKPVTDYKIIGTGLKPSSGKDPKGISLEEKHDLCQRYNSLILNCSPLIQTSKVTYRDTYKKGYFVNSEGSDILQDKIFTGISFLALAKNGMNVQQAQTSFGNYRGYGTVEKLESKAEEVAKLSVDLLKAKSVTGGKYTVVLDPQLTGVFIHEAFGHLAEADHIYENEKMEELMRLGKRFGVDDLCIVDNATLPDEAGSYFYDEEGVPATKNYLVKDGIFSHRLHSRETAAKMGESPTGNARAINYNFEPIVRMSNTYLEPRNLTFEEMLSDIKDGIYAKAYIGGNTDCEMFTFSAQQAYLIKNGKIDNLVRDVVLTGNVFETLMNIEAIGNDLILFGGLGGCGKGGQSPLPVSDGGPHIRIKNILIG
ncbi:MAG: TldD/PmbA family protein [bacterium]|nr:TldD/PmbA family protein [bacterium]